MNKMKDYNVLLNNIEADENINAPILQEINLGEGYIKYFIQPQEGLLYKVLSNHTGCSMNDELDLLNYVFKTAYACSKYYTQTSKQGEWYLPSKIELDLLYRNLKDKIIATGSAGWHWSSSQYNNYYAWYQRSSDGYQSNYDKNRTGSVRAVRAF